MKIAIINVPFRAPGLAEKTWITVPPQGYGGIQWNVAFLIDGLLEIGHEVYLLGAPGSPSPSALMHVIEVGDRDDIDHWLQINEVDIVHDFSNGAVSLAELSPRHPHISTHHFTGRPKYPVNTVYVSYAQRQTAGIVDAPVIRVPINPKRHWYKREKQDYLLFLGRISPWKGALEAAAFAKAAKIRLIIAGPAWEEDYLRQIQKRYGDVVIYIGEVGGEKRLALLSQAKAVLVLSQPVPGPWGDIWCEPGATVVSEAAVSGTPVISSDNGCLAEIVPLVGCALPCGVAFTTARAHAVLDSLPSPDSLRETAIREWGHVKIARQYESCYLNVIQGKQWL